MTIIPTPNFMNWWTIVKDTCTVSVGAFAAINAVRTYRRNAGTRRAELLVDMHKAFFVDETYKAVRQVLDSDEESAEYERQRYAQKQPEEFIEFLNFFEMVA